MKVAFHTLGCRSNYSDTVALSAMCKERGATPTEDIESADVYVVNTCTVTETADREAHKLIRRAKSIKPDLRIVVTGCYAEVSRESLENDDSVDRVVGTGHHNEVVNAIFDLPTPVTNVSPSRKAAKEKKSYSLEDSLSTEISSPGECLGEVASRSRYHLRIQEGCENSCTFCIIPFSRGGLTSRPVQKILDDLFRLSDLGYHEVVLTGTHIGGYGQDRNTSLISLLEEIEKQQPVSRIRLSSIDPNDISKEMIDLIANKTIFCRHLHVCMQAFDDLILKRMNRRYKLSEALEMISYIENAFDQPCLGTDVITGFPGETKAQIEKTVEFIEELPFSYLHVFPYSERSFTSAVNLGNQVPVDERRRRSGRLRAVGALKKQEYYKSFIGKDLSIVVEENNGKYISGTSNEYISVKINTDLRSSASERIVTKISQGALVEVKATEIDVLDGKLICELLDEKLH